METRELSFRRCWKGYKLARTPWKTMWAPQKIKTRTSLWFDYITPEFIPWRSWNWCVRHGPCYAYCSGMHSSLQVRCPSIKGLDGDNVVQMKWSIYFIHKQDWDPVICGKTNRNRRNYMTWSILGRRREAHKLQDYTSKKVPIWDSCSTSSSVYKL